MYGKLITFEGPDKAGKSSQFRLVQDYLLSEFYDVTVTREPGGTPLGDEMRRLLLNPDTKISEKTELFLFETARSNLIDEVIKPSLEEGHIVLCDRFIDSSLAYQGYGRGIDLGIIEKLNEIATNHLIPDLTLLYLDKVAKRDGTRLEQLGDEFEEKVRKGYFELARKDTERIKIVKKIEGENIDDRIKKTFEEGTLPFIEELLSQ